MLPPGAYIIGEAGEYKLVKTGVNALSTRIVPYDPEKDLCRINQIPNCEPNFVLSIDSTDPMLDLMWNDEAFGYYKAWETREHSNDIKVMILDSGVNCKHEDIDCEKEYNAIEEQEGEGQAQDDNGHGTHVAGTACAIGSNGKGVSGVSKRCRLYAVKFLGANGSGSTFDAVKGVRWGISQEVDVINMSFGGGAKSQALESAISDANNHGIVIIGAAGNEGTNNDQRPHYPSNYSGVISVASSGPDGRLSQFSNYGVLSVDGSAPGGNILSLWADGNYRQISGTSMAAPHITGAIALLLAQKRDLPKTARAEWAIQQLFDTATPDDTHQVRFGAFNVGRAIAESGAGPQCKPKKCKNCFRDCTEKYDCNCKRWRRCKRDCRELSSCGIGCK